MCSCIYVLVAICNSSKVEDIVTTRDCDQHESGSQVTSECNVLNEGENDLIKIDYSSVSGAARPLHLGSTIEGNPLCKILATPLMKAIT